MKRSIFDIQEWEPTQKGKKKLQTIKKLILFFILEAYVIVVNSFSNYSI